MRPLIHLCLGFALLCAGCAYEGTIVHKEFRILPFSESLGIDAIYKFELRDRAGQLHWQMVTPEVFTSYSQGDYFNDLQIPASPLETPPPGTTLPRVPRRGPTEIRQIPYQPIRTTAVSTHRKTAVAARSLRAKHAKSLAKKAKSRKSRRKLARRHRHTERNPA
ncbi:MAG TPA: hypothetical protein VHW03_03075 [Chthoniobacterales bacterium]|nr:hypothetical protein [Chthoniobacterales bacterium]